MQTIISGPKVSEELANKIRTIIELKGLSITKDWITQHGNIGYMNNLSIEPSSIKKQFKELGKMFLSLEVGVTIMSGNSGEYNIPKENFVLKNGKIEQNVLNPHAGHPAPTKFKV